MRYLIIILIMIISLSCKSVQVQPTTKFDNVQVQPTTKFDNNWEIVLENVGDSVIINTDVRFYTVPGFSILFWQSKDCSRLDFHGILTDTTFVGKRETRLSKVYLSLRIIDDYILIGTYKEVYNDNSIVLMTILGNKK